MARQVLSAITATPEGTALTLTTPGIACAAPASKDFNVAPNTGGRATAA